LPIKESTLIVIISEGFVADQLLFVFNPQRKIRVNTNLKARHSEQGRLLARWQHRLIFWPFHF